jgi:NADH dehydrogenase
MGDKTRILILGGGFGGLYTALELERRVGGDPNVEVTLVNRENFFSFTPMLHEVAASDLDLTHIVNPVRKMLRHVNFVLADVDGIDLEARKVAIRHGTDHHAHELEYDHLVLGLGSITNFYGLPGLAERALTMKSLGDAIHLRNEMIAHLEEADTECAAMSCQREPLLTCVVVGGGFAGVETIAAVNDFVRDALPYYRNLSDHHVRMVLVHSGATILPELGEKLGRYAQKKLEKRGIEIHTKTRVLGVDDDGVKLNDGTVVKARTVVWTAGTSPNPLLAALACANQHGKLSTNEFMEVPGFPGLWAVGDCAMIPDAKSGTSYPPTAQHALREGKVLAQNIVAAVRGGRKKAFAFSTIGQLATIGRRTGVARIMGVNFSGFVAWWLWRTIYLAKLPRAEKKLRVALDWTLDILFSKDLVQFNVGRTSGS